MSRSWSAGPRSHCANGASPAALFPPHRSTGRVQAPANSGSGIRGAERRPQRGTRLGLVIDAPCPIDELRESPLEPARPTRKVPAFDRLEHAVLPGVFEFDERELPSCRTADRDVASETAEKRSFHRQQVGCSQRMIGKTERRGEMSRTPYKGQNLFRFPQRAPGLQQPTECIEFSAERAQITGIPVEHFAQWAVVSVSSRKYAYCSAPTTSRTRTRSAVRSKNTRSVGVARST